MKAPKILVTGGLGYIGSHTVVDLLQKDFDVVVVDNLINSRIEVLSGIENICGKQPRFYQVDINETEQLKEVFEKEGNIDSVVHFAAYKAVGESVEFPLKYYNNNVGGLISLLTVMKDSGTNKIVFSSSCTVYGDTDQSPVDEYTAIAKAASPYGATKIICEDILRDTSQASNLQVVSLRYFNPVGAHPSAEIGELPLGVPNNLVPYITQTAAGIRKELTVHGGDYETPDGTCIRDYIHVVDLADAHVTALDWMNKNNSSFEVFNLGTGNGSSVLDVINAFEKSSSQKLNYRIGPRRAGDVTKIWASTEKAKNVLGWTAKLALEDMMKSAWEWQKRVSEI